MLPTSVVQIDGYNYEKCSLSLRVWNLPRLVSVKLDPRSGAPRLISFVHFAVYVFTGLHWQNDR